MALDASHIADNTAAWLLGRVRASISLAVTALLCGAAQAGLQSVEVSGGQPVTIYTPNGGKPGPRPIVLLLHGSRGSGAPILQETGLADTAERHGFVVAAPNGGITLDRGYAWNVPGVPTVSGKMPDASARDDVAYLNRVLDDLITRRIADPRRIYVTGLSGGGRMASWLACVDAGRIAAAAPVVGLRAGAPSASDPREPDPASCRPSTSVPILAFAGDSDTTNPISGGGAPYWQYPMDAAERRWAALDGCSLAVRPRSISATAYERRYERCKGGAQVRSRITIGGQHSWKVADNDAMWAFFSRHRR